MGFRVSHFGRKAQKTEDGVYNALDLQCVFLRLGWRGHFSPDGDHFWVVINRETPQRGPFFNPTYGSQGTLLRVYIA